MAATLNDLAATYRSQGKYVEAERLYQRALGIREQVLGTDHRDVAETLNNLAIVYHAQGKYTDAERLHQRALAIRERALGANHPDVAMTLGTWRSSTSHKATTRTPSGSIGARWRSGSRCSGRSTPK